MKRHKIGETKPYISKDEALFLHNDSDSCSKPYLVRKPTARIEEQKGFSLKYYSENCWLCLNCKWESERMRKRTT